MEIPYMIIDEVKRLEQIDIVNNQISLSLTINNNTYIIKISPSVLQYRGLYFHIKSQDVFDTVLQNILQNILEESKQSLMIEIEYNNYSPQDDPFFDILQACLQGNDTTYMHWEFPTSTYNLLQTFTKKMSFLYFLIPKQLAEKDLINCV